jgi:hypothetical protein
VLKLPGIALAIALAGGLWAQAGGTTPKAKPEDYPAETRAGQLAIGAEYLLHSVPAGNRTFVVDKFLVVEAAVFPAAGRTVEVGSHLFTLRVFGKKKMQEFAAASPEMVAFAVEHSDWERNRGMEVQAGPIVLGGQTRSPRFPGDSTGTTTTPSRAPDQGAEAATAPEAVRQSAFPDGPIRGPASGCLYFPFPGKTKAIESARLVFHSPDGEIVVRLF